MESNYFKFLSLLFIIMFSMNKEILFSGSYNWEDNGTGTPQNTVSVFAENWSGAARDYRSSSVAQII